VSSDRFDELARDGERLGATGVAGDKAAELGSALERVRERAQDFFRVLVNHIASRGGHTAENRVRITASMVEPCYEDAALVMGSLDHLQATAALIKPPAPGPDHVRESPRLDLAGLADRAGELRDELRFVLQAGERDYVFLETAPRHCPFARRRLTCRISCAMLFDRMSHRPDLRHTDRRRTIRLHPRAPGPR
jgi:hypothetical protein